MSIKPAKTTPAQRAEIYRRHQAGEKTARLAAEYGISGEYARTIILKHRDAEQAGESATTRKRRNLSQLIPDQLQALRALVTSKTPAELGLTQFSGWNYRSVQAAMRQLCDVRLMQFEAEQFLTDCGLPIVAVAPSRRRVEEQFDQDYYDYINSDIGRQVRERAKEAEARELAEAAERVRSRQNPGRRAGDPANAAAAPTKSSPGRAVESLSVDEMERRLQAAAAMLDGDKVQAVLDHYQAAPKKRGTNLTPSKKKRRK